MFHIEQYDSSLKHFDDMTTMYKTGGEASFSFQNIGPNQIMIKGAWLKKNKTAIPYLVDLIFRVAKTLGGWGGGHHPDNGAMQDPPSIIDRILACEDLSIYRYDLSSSKYTLVVLDKIFSELGVEYTTEDPSEDKQTEVAAG